MNERNISSDSVKEASASTRAPSSAFADISDTAHPGPVTTLGDDHQPKGRRLMRILYLNQGVSYKHAAAFFASVFIQISTYVFLSSTAPYYLASFIGIPTENQGKVLGAISFAQELTVMCTSTIWGSFSDRFGRIPVQCLGLFLQSCALVALAYSRSFSVLIACRFVFALGSGASSAILTALLGDLVWPPDKGKGGAAFGVSAGFGAIFSVFVLAAFPEWIYNWALLPDGTHSFSQMESTMIMFHVMSALNLVSLVIAFFGLPTRAQTFQNSQTTLRPSFIKGLRLAVAESRKNPKLLLVFMAAFTSRSDLVVVGAFVNLWIQQYAQSVGIDSVTAVAKASSIVGMASISGIITTPISGYIFDKVGGLETLGMLSVVAAAAYIMVGFVVDPLGWFMILSILLLGWGEFGMATASTSLISLESPQAFRGSLSGMFNLCGGIGILIAANVGGALYDGVGPAAPFFFVSSFNIILAVATLIVWLRGRRVRVLQASVNLSSIGQNADWQSANSASAGDWDSSTQHEDLQINAPKQTATP